MYCPTCLNTFKPKGREKFCSLRCAIFGRVDRGDEDACWPWSGAIGTHGYGVFDFCGEHWLTHRAAYVVSNGPIPDAEGSHGGVVLHSCDNRPCCNPGHLRAGSQAENLDDAHRKGRIGKLTHQQVDAIRLDQRPHRVIAAAHGVTKGAVSHIKTGRTWRK